MKSIRALAIGAAGATLFAAASLAQQGGQQGQQISQQDLRGFFQQIEQEITQARRSGDVARLAQWTRQNIADGAMFTLSNEVYEGDRRKAFGLLTVSKQDILRGQQIALGIQHDRNREALQDHSFNIELRNVEQVAPGVAMVSTRITERATIAPQAGRQAQAGGQGDADRTGSVGQGQQGAQAQQGGVSQQAQAAQPGRQDAGGAPRQLRIEGVTNCEHLIRRTSGDGFQVGMTSCQGQTRLQ